MFQVEFEKHGFGFQNKWTTNTNTKNDIPKSRFWDVGIEFGDVGCVRISFAINLKPFPVHSDWKSKKSYWNQYTNYLLTLSWPCLGSHSGVICFIVPFCFHVMCGPWVPSLYLQRYWCLYEKSACRLLEKSTQRDSAGASMGCLCTLFHRSPQNKSGNLLLPGQSHFNS